MVNFFLELISTLLLITASLMLIFWKKSLKKPGSQLIKNIGVCVGLIGLYALINSFSQIFSLTGYVMALVNLPTLIGFVFLMFSLFNYLEANKK